MTRKTGKKKGKGRNSQFKASSQFPTTQMQTRPAPLTPPPKPPRNWRAGIWALFVLVITAAASLIGPSWYDEYVKSHPKIMGSIVASSFGPVTPPETGPRGQLKSSILVYIEMQNLREVGFIPTNYWLNVKYKDFWSPAPADGTTSDHAIRFSDTRSADIGREGVWTACIRPEHYLYSQALLSQPVLRDKPMTGFLRFYSYLPAEELVRRERLVIVVADSEGHQFEFAEKPELVTNASRKALFRRAVEGTSRFYPGALIDCSKAVTTP